MARTAESKRWYVEEVGTVVSGRDEAIDDEWGLVESRIELTSGFGPARGRTRGLQPRRGRVPLRPVDPRSVCRGARRPRGQSGLAEWASSPSGEDGRPPPGSRRELLAVEGTALTVRGLDAVAGTRPVLDITPVLAIHPIRGELRAPRVPTS